MRILVIEDETALIEVYSFWFESELGAEIVAAKSLDEARKVLESDQAFSMVMTDFRLPDGSSDLIIPLIRQKCPGVPVLLCSGSPRDSIPLKPEDIEGFLPKPFRFSDLGAMIDKITAKAPAPAKTARAPAAAPAQGQFCSLGLGTLQRIGLLPFDLYMRLGPEKTVKVLKAGTMFDEVERNRFKEKAVEVLLAPAADVRAFSAKEADMLLRLAVEPNLKSNLLVAQSTLALVAAMAKDIGWPEEASELATRVLDLTVASIRESPDVCAALKGVLDYPESYLSAHSVALAHVACALACKLGWKSDLTFYKICMASLFHDVALEDSALCRVQSSEDLALMQGRYSKEEITSWQGHSESSARTLQRFSAAEDVLHAVRVHHERADRSGPLGLGPDDVSPLGALIAVGHAIVSFYIERKDGCKLQEFLAGPGARLQKGAYKKILQALSA